MKRMVWLALAAVPVLIGAQVAQQEKAPDKALIEHGRYIAHHVAMCVECHSPRDDDGELIETKYFQGAHLRIDSNYDAISFAPRAPKIANLPGYTTEDAVRLLMEGATPRGTTPKAPMPPFRMSEHDARAVTAYLKSLNTGI
jgi:mono/diheme cytochrome c family protein